MQLQVIAKIHNDFTQKFGIPRQSGLAPHARSSIVFEPEFAVAEALRGIDEFSHLWLIWQFDRAVRGKKTGDGGGSREVGSTKASNGGNSRAQRDANANPTDPRIKKGAKAGEIVDSRAQRGTEVDECGKPRTIENVKPDESVDSHAHTTWRPTVRPPRLGGNERVGVFATRSPYRPNSLGLSVVRLECVDWHTPKGPVLHVLGADIMDGTPIFDIKPYLPYADAHAEAESGFVEKGSEPQKFLQVEIPHDVRDRIPVEKVKALSEILSCDPRPAYHNDPRRIYSMAFGGLDVSFKVHDNVLEVVDAI